MDLRQLEQIVAIRRAGGFTAAARRLGISQPTLSKSISRLESMLSLSLFERTPSGSRPTAYGDYIADRAEALLADAANLVNEVGELAHGGRGRLRIGVGPAARIQPLPQILAVAAERYPGLQLTTVTDEGPALLRALIKGRLDFILTFSGFAANHGDLIRVKMLEDETICAARSDHPVLSLQPAGPAELLQFPIASAWVNPTMKAWLGDIDRPMAENLAAFRSDDYTLIREQALVSSMIAVAPRFVFEPYLARGELTEVRTTRPRAPYECWMLTTPERWRSPLMKSLIDATKRSLREASALEADIHP